VSKIVGGWVIAISVRLVASGVAMVVRVAGWRRFERASNDGGGRFWAIRVDGRECEIRFGAF
jgi:hypothetical protein